MTLPELLEKIGADNLHFQLLTDAATKISAERGGSRITFVTQALTPINVATNTGPIGLIVWCDRAAWEAALPKGGQP